MPLSKTTQDKLARKAKIAGILIDLIENYGMDGREIAGRLKVKEATVSKLKNERQVGSEQMLSALEMLLELTQLKMFEVNRLRSKLEDLTQSRVKFESKLKELKPDGLQKSGDEIAKKAMPRLLKKPEE